MERNQRCTEKIVNNIFLHVACQLKMYSWRKGYVLEM